MAETNDVPSTLVEASKNDFGKVKLTRCLVSLYASGKRVDGNRLRYLQANPSRKALYKHDTRRPAEVRPYNRGAKPTPFLFILCGFHATMFFATYLKNVSVSAVCSLILQILFILAALRFMPCSLKQVL